MSRKLTKEEFINREPDLLSGEYEFVGEYINATTKTLFKHNTCGYEWMIVPYSFHAGHRCPRCTLTDQHNKQRFTKDEFCKREEDIQSGEYEMLGEYTTARKKTLFRHNKCGYRWETAPYIFHQGGRCPRCGDCTNLNKELFCEREEDMVSGEYSMLGEYVNNSTNTLFRHNVCGFEWMLRPNNFYNGKRCPKCAHRKIADNQRLDKISFCERESDIKNGEYLMLGEYINSQTKTLFRHNICGYEWEITPNSFHQKHRCPRCQGVERLTKESFCEREDDIQSGEYELVGNYKNTLTKTLFKHNVCGYEWKASPAHFYSGKRCPRCAGNIKLTKEEFCDREEDIKSSEYMMLSSYKGMEIKALFKHTVCGHEWQTRPADFHAGNRCPRCKQSKGEKKVLSVLENIAVTFETQKKFNSCKDKRPLPFDFYVNDSFLIEYDGEQHFKPVDFTGKGNEWADKSFKSGQIRDNIKTQWAKDNGIPLVRIPYTEFDNIEQIIRDSIEKYSIKEVG